ncbi:pantothenate synthetase [Geobacter sp. AOG1]|nr:pantothenate synthetase [Geobacter sp. AOG1]
MQNLSRAAHRSGRTIALVPTMGYLHDGHASLLRGGRRRGDLLVLSIFVNPTQFGVGEDFESYPRDLARDRAVAESAGVDVIFAPRAGDMYPAGFQTYVDVERLTLPLCGASRPGHFRGVTTVVSKLLNIVQPDVALFGAKDYQQLAVIRRMVADLNMPVEVVGMPIVREADGLALSSRNAYLSPEQRQAALCLSHSLRTAKELYKAGERTVATLREQVTTTIAAEASATIDYIEFRHGDSLEEVAVANGHTLIALAVKIGTTRLIDNCLLGEE